MTEDQNAPVPETKTSYFCLMCWKTSTEFKPAAEANRRTLIYDKAIFYLAQIDANRPPIHLCGRCYRGYLQGKHAGRRVRTEYQPNRAQRRAEKLDKRRFERRMARHEYRLEHGF